SPALEVEPSNACDVNAKADEIEFLGMVCYGEGKHPSLVADFLPPIVHMKADTPECGQWANEVIAIFRSEHHVARPGRHSLLSRVAELVCVQVSRYLYLHSPRETKG